MRLIPEPLKTSLSKTRRRPAAIRFAALVFAAVMIAGCSRETGPVCHPVRGKVLYDNQPLAEALILFHPLDGGTKEVPKPLAYSDQAGNFELTTLQPRDGAPAGKYAITIELRELKPDGDEMVRDGRNLLPDRYRDPKSSGLEFVVEEGENEIAPIELESK